MSRGWLGLFLDRLLGVAEQADADAGQEPAQPCFVVQRAAARL
ncbi:hypothetical protein [Streptomyces sp. NPDC058861]